DRRKQMNIHSSLFLTAAQSLSINGNALQRAGRRGFLQNTLGPLPDLLIKSFLVQTPKDRVKRSNTRGFSVLEPQSQRQFGAIMLSPFRHGAVTSVSAQNCGAREAEYGSQAMPLALILAEVRHFGQHFNQWTTLFHEQATLQKIVACKYTR